MRCFYYSFLIFSIFTSARLFAQQVSFYKEDLHFYLNGNSFITDGYYYFSNNDSLKINQLIFYPFPLGEPYGKVDSVYIKEGASVYFRIRDKEIPATITKLPFIKKSK